MLSHRSTCIERTVIWLSRPSPHYGQVRRIRRKRVRRRRMTTRSHLFLSIVVLPLVKVQMERLPPRRVTSLPLNQV